MVKWNEESIKRYEEVTRKKIYEETSMEGKWKEIKGTIEDGVTKVNRKAGEILKNKSWDKECGRKKREIRKLLRNGRRKRRVKEKYLREKTEFLKKYVRGSEKRRPEANWRSEKLRQKKKYGDILIKGGNKGCQ